jgi:hypothetical protein
MKTVRNTLSALILMTLFLTIPLMVQAQGHGHGKDNKQHGKGHKKDYDSYDKRSNSDYYRNHRHGNEPSWNDHHRNETPGNQQRYVTYRHHRHSHPSWAPAYGYRYNTRYIYYHDYNVYYDCHRDVFMVWTGRNWRLSAHIPDAMLRVDFHRTRVYGVNYWDDDFDFYLERRRPSYLSISAGW